MPAALKLQLLLLFQASLSPSLVRRHAFDDARTHLQGREQAMRGDKHEGGRTWN
jgi:hypothetical protein